MPARGGHSMVKPPCHRWSACDALLCAYATLFVVGRLTAVVLQADVVPACG